MTRRRRTRELALTTVSLTCSAMIALAFAYAAATLVRYPWDWSPDDGMTLDAAMRFGRGLEALYNHVLPPWPWAYGPLLPALLAWLRPTEASLAVGRLVAAGWTAVLVFSVLLLVRRTASWRLAVPAAMFVLTPLYCAGFYLLLRVDVPMCALWALSAAALVPRRIEPGADRLSWPRVLLGTLLVDAAFLAKATAAVHALPLVLAWWFVDRRSFTRLAAALAIAGGLTVAGLQRASAGGFLYVSSLLGDHPLAPWQVPWLFSQFVALNAPLLLFLSILLLLARRGGLAPLRDGSVAMVLGGVLAIPLLAKGGATWHYLLPLQIGSCVLLGRTAGALAARRHGWDAPLAAVAGLVAATAALSRPFLLPDARAEATSRAFYDVVKTSAVAGSGPLLALRPDYAYVALGQPLEVDAGGSFLYLATKHVPGTETVLERLQGSVYSVVTWGPWFFPEQGGWSEALVSRYRPVAACKLRFYFGSATFVVAVRRSEPLRPLRIPPLADCSLVADEPAVEALRADPR